MPSYSRKIGIPGKTAAEIYERVKGSIDRFQEKDMGRFGKFSFHLNDAERTVRLESSYVSANLNCRDGEVLLEGKLSLMVSAFRGKIDAGIDAWIRKAFKTEISDDNNPV